MSLLNMLLAAKHAAYHAIDEDIKRRGMSRRDPRMNQIAAFHESKALQRFTSQNRRSQFDIPNIVEQLLDPCALCFIGAPSSGRTLLPLLLVIEM